VLTRKCGNESVPIARDEEKHQAQILRGIVQQYMHIAPPAGERPNSCPMTLLGPPPFVPIDARTSDAAFLR